MPRLLRYHQLRSEKSIPYSRQHLERLMAAGDFPRKIKQSHRVVVWDESEVDAWLATRRARSGATAAGVDQAVVAEGLVELERVLRLPGVLDALQSLGRRKVAAESDA